MAQDPSALLNRAAQRDRQAVSALTPLVYDQLRVLAGKYIREIGQGKVLLQRTALVHEAFIQLIGDDRDLRTRTHFCAVAATAMRHALCDHVREQNCAKRGKSWRRLTLAGLINAEDGDGDIDLDALEAALVELAALDERAAEVVQLRFFGGLSQPEVADVLEVSERSVRSDWLMARAWLRSRLEGWEPSP